MNEYFENTHHLKSLIPKSSGFQANISISYVAVPIGLKGKYRDKFKGKEHNRERWERKIEKYKTVDLSKMYEEIELIDWDYVTTLKTSSLCPYCNIGQRKTRDHFIPTYYRKCIYYQKKPELSPLKLVVIKCCNACNKKKGNLLPSEWLEEIILKMEESVSIDRYYLNVKENLMNILRLP